MKKLLQILIVTAFTAAASDMTLTVEQLTKFIKSAVQLKQPDRQVAEYLKHVKLSDRLDDRTIEELQGLGAGMKTVAALKELGESSARLPAPPPPPPPPPPPKLPDPPDSIEQARVVDAAREYALNYEKQLPNFICAEVTRRYVDPHHTGARSLQDPDWRLADTVTTKLTYFDHEEKYEVQMVNNSSVVNVSMEKLGGAVSMGEFGSMMREIFEHKSAARFEWDKWATVRGRRMYVFAFDIDKDHSKYSIVWDRSEKLTPAYRGKIYVDKETNMIVKIVETPYDIPLTFPVQAVSTVLDFDFTKIGESEYMVPLKVVVTSATSRYLARNDKEFRLYRRFGADTTIKFDTPDPLPTEKTQEKPVKQP
jgi:hypothetical protein